MGMSLHTDPKEHLLSLRDVAAKLDLSLRGVYRLIANGSLPPPVKVGRSSKIFASDLHQYFETLKTNRTN